MTSKPDIALITGASSGIGLALAREFAKHGHPLVLVSPVKPEIEDVAARIAAEFDVSAHAVATDLSRETAADEIFDYLIDGGIGIDILVNNAGLGQPDASGKPRWIATSRSCA